MSDRSRESGWTRRDFIIASSGAALSTALPLGCGGEPKEKEAAEEASKPLEITWDLTHVKRFFLNNKLQEEQYQYIKNVLIKASRILRLYIRIPQEDALNYTGIKNSYCS